MLVLLDVSAKPLKHLIILKDRNSINNLLSLWISTKGYYICILFVFQLSMLIGQSEPAFEFQFTQAWNLNWGTDLLLDCKGDILSVNHGYCILLFFLERRCFSRINSFTIGKRSSRHLKCSWFVLSDQLRFILNSFQLLSHIFID